jgi:hypothetical protein
METLRQLLRDERGNATGEAVIMLPFFIMVWGCIMWASQAYEKAIDVGAKTREHAWAHAMNACKSSVPGGTEVRDVTDPVFGPIGDTLSVVDSIIDTIPVIGDYWPGFFPTENRYVRRDSIDTPDVMGGGSKPVGHTIVLMCNEDLDTPGLAESSESSWGIFGF